MTTHTCSICHQRFQTFTANGFSQAFVNHQNEHRVMEFVDEE